MTDKRILTWYLFRAADGREWICTRTHSYIDCTGTRWMRVGERVQAATRREAEALLRAQQEGEMA